MIVYVESNFVLELAFLREEHECCAILLSLAESSKIDLALPAFCVGEPYEAWVRRSHQRTELNRRLGEQIRELSRSEPYRESSQEMLELTRLLTESGEQEKHRLDEALDTILNVAQVIPIELKTVRRAIALQESHSLSPQDSIVCASIFDHLPEAPEGPKYFVTKDSKDFLNPDIENELRHWNCRLLTKFSNALGHVRSCL